MIGIAFSLLMMVVLALIVLTVGMKLMQNYKPGRTKIQKDLMQIRAELAPYIADLVPWSSEEMQQLSYNQIKRSSKSSFGRKARKGYSPRFTTNQL